MNADRLKSILGTIAVAAAPVLTAIYLFVPLKGGGHDAVVALLTLAWQMTGTVLRSQFPGPEINAPVPMKEAA
ncbi:hypothetical protein [Sandarakinorhabdus sp.]|uniref:hypothetical protein n=1 Tax=Sandarakinorhabdus sp. TaxID=1916663 RepID=UPI00286DA135|nr:hypothetical protein [Sandarakinorhabdus sp.]